MSDPLIKVIRSKLHGIHVTDANLNYHGSITLDPEQCALAGFYPLEFVDIWNKHSGARISTYVIFGEPGSRCCILNGAAARTCQRGDEIIVAASQYCTPGQLAKVCPKVLTFDKQNRIQSTILYHVEHNNLDSIPYQFSMEEKSFKHSSKEFATFEK